MNQIHNKMKNLIFAVILIVLMNGASLLGQEYERAMETAVSDLAECETIEDLQDLANVFKRIGDAEKEEWLPLYYHSYCYTIMSFMSEGDGTQMDEYLDVAQSNMVRLEDLVPDESEIWVLQAFIYTGRLVVDPMTRGQEYSFLSSQSNQKALSLSPENPRAQYMELANAIGMAQFFGNDVSVYCKEAENLLADWDRYQVASAIQPSWGKNNVKEIVQSCHQNQD